MMSLRRWSRRARSARGCAKRRCRSAGQPLAAQLAAYRRGAPPDDPADLTTRCAGFIKPRYLNSLVRVELIILRSHGNSALYQRCTWRHLGPAELRRARRAN
jgi:hypothetical protein